MHTVCSMLNLNSPSSISNCCIVSVQGEIICMVESTLSTPKCLVLSSNITSSLADNHHLIASVVVVLTPRTLPMSTQGKRFQIFVIICSLKNYVKTLLKMDKRKSSASTCRRNASSRKIQADFNFL